MTHIRLPVSFTYHLPLTKQCVWDSYELNATFMERLDEILSMAIHNNSIKVILDQHHYAELQADPRDEQPRAQAIWEQLATRYADYDESMLYFEVQNEPHDAFNDDPELLNDYLNSTVQLIRQTNPTRKILVGPNQWNGLSGLQHLELPPNDPNLILTMHYYSPGGFTHQGAEWVTDAPAAGSVDWDPSKMNLWWWDYSWGLDKKVVNETKGMKVKYNSAWSMLSLHQPGGINNVATAVVTTETTTGIRLGLKFSFGKNDDDSWNFVYSTEINTGIGTNSFEFNVTGTGTVSEIHLQNLSGENQEEFFLNEYHVILKDGTKVPTFVSSQESIYLDLSQMVRWGNLYNIPVHLGEFGAYHTAPSPDREAWTRAVREAAERLEMDWSYWELVAGFGFWDADADDLKEEGIRDALVN